MPRQRTGWVLPTVGRKVPRSWRCHQAAVDFSKVSPSPNHGHFLQSWVVINELLSSQRWVQSQSSTFSWVFSSSQWVADLSKLSSFPSHPRNSESWVVLNKLMFFKVGFISQSWTNWLQASIYWQMSACYAPDRWLVPSVGDSDFLCRWLRPFSSMWNELVLSLCLNWMTHVLRKLLFVFDA